MNRFVTGTLKKEGPEKTNKKRGRGEQSTPVAEDMTGHIVSDVEEFNTPSKEVKGKAEKKNKKKIKDFPGS